MKPSTRARLLQLNREFYDRFAAEFAASRSNLTPGILRALSALQGSRSLLDLGCGDGRILRTLASGRIPNEVRRYVGIDFSTGLLEQAFLRPSVIDHRFVRAELASPDWPEEAGLGEERFDAVTCFAVLFHIPGEEDRARLLRQVRERLSPGGRAAISIWRFLHLPRLREKIAPWKSDPPEATAGDAPMSTEILADEVDPGDYLIDWRRGGTGLRYVHHFEDEEIDRLMVSAGFSILERYRSDGRSGDLSLFLILSSASP